MKFRLVICDNDAEDLNKNEKLVKRYIEIHQIKNSIIEKYQNPLDLIENCNINDVDVFLLDVLMPHLNGIDVGKKIRELNKNVPIIFMTSSREYAFEAYGIHALGYLEKPIVEDQLEELFMMLPQKEDKSSKILLNTKMGMVSIDENELVYIENLNRTAIYHMVNGDKIVSTCNRKSFEESVADIGISYGFMHPHKSYYVNMQYIKLIYQMSITLDNDTEIPISKKHLGEIKRTYLDFMTNEEAE